MDHIVEQAMKMFGNPLPPKSVIPVPVPVVNVSATPEVKPFDFDILNTEINNVTKIDDQIDMFNDDIETLEKEALEKESDIYNIPPILDKDCWQTPPELMKYIYDRFGINGYMFDPCPPNPKVNGLLIDWEKCSYVNPPYSRGEQLKWVKKAVEESNKSKDVYMLIPSDTSTKIWHDYVMKYAYMIYLIKGRIKFVGATGMPKFGNALVHFSGCTLGMSVCETIDYKIQRKSKLKNFMRKK